MPAGTMAPIVTVHVIEKWAAGPGNKTPTPGETVPPLCVCVCVCVLTCVHVHSGLLVTQQTCFPWFTCYFLREGQVL